MNQRIKNHDRRNTKISENFRNIHLERMDVFSDVAQRQFKIKNKNERMDKNGRDHDYRSEF